MKINIKRIALHTLLNILLIVFCHFLAIFINIVLSTIFGDYSYTNIRHTSHNSYSIYQKQIFFKCIVLKFCNSDYGGFIFFF